MSTLLYSLSNTRFAANCNRFQACPPSSLGCFQGQSHPLNRMDPGLFAHGVVMCISPHASDRRTNLSAVELFLQACCFQRLLAQAQHSSWSSLLERYFAQLAVMRMRKCARKFSKDRILLEVAGTFKHCASLRYLSELGSIMLCFTKRQLH